MQIYKITRCFPSVDRKKVNGINHFCNIVIDTHI
jgi:hypothetical protein